VKSFSFHLVNFLQAGIFITLAPCEDVEQSIFYISSGYEGSGSAKKESTKQSFENLLITGEDFKFIFLKKQSNDEFHKAFQIVFGWLQSSATSNLGSSKLLIFPADLSEVITFPLLLCFLQVPFTLLLTLKTLKPNPQTENFNVRTNHSLSRSLSGYFPCSRGKNLFQPLLFLQVPFFSLPFYPSRS